MGPRLALRETAAGTDTGTRRQRAEQGGFLSAARDQPDDVLRVTEKASAGANTQLVHPLAISTTIAPSAASLTTLGHRLSGRSSRITPPARKKTLQEQTTALTSGRHHWLEPFQNWILTAKTKGEIAIGGTPEQKKVLAREIFGSNLLLDRKKARGYCLKPWSEVPKFTMGSQMVRSTGFEPVTF